MVENGLLQEVSKGHIGEVAEYIKEHKEEIEVQIRERKYKPQPVKRVEIPKENGKKGN